MGWNYDSSLGTLLTERPTIEDVATRARVSVGTVSRVVNRIPGVRQPMVQAVERAIRELGYEPNLAARQLRSNRSGSIGLIVSDLLQGTSAIAARSAQETAGRRGFSLLLADARNSHDIEQRLLADLSRRGAEGVLLGPTSSIVSAKDVAFNVGLPVVVFGQPYIRAGLSTAIVDEQVAVHLALTSLVELGHRRFLVTGKEGYVPLGRVELVTAELQSQLGDFANIQIHTVTDSAAGFREVQTALGSPQSPTAILSVSDDSLPYVLLAVREAGLVVPADVSVLGFEDSEWVEAHTPPIDVIRSDNVEHVRQATNYLIDSIQGCPKDPPAPVAVAHYVQRSSTARSQGDSEVDFMTFRTGMQTLGG